MPENKKKDEERAEVSLGLGLGGIFKGLGDLVDLVTGMIDTNQEGVQRSGEFHVKGMGDKGRGVYGFTVRTGIGGIPRVDHFGNIRTTEEGPMVTDVREPLVDLFDEEHEIVIVAELPGVVEDEIYIEIQDDILTLQTTGERKYAKEILLSQKADVATLHKTYRNGILELRIQKAL